MKRLLRHLPVVIIVGAAVAAAVVVARDRHQLADSIGRLGFAATLVSLVVAVASVIVVALVWRTILGGLGAPTPLPDALQVFLVSQLGKYLPGSIWPVVTQMEFGARRGIARRTMLAANVLTLAITVTVGLVMAAAMLPFSSADALHRYWWTFLLLPVLLVCLHPVVVPAVLNRLLRLLRRETLSERLDWGATAAAIGWAALSWLIMGLHLYVIVDGLGTSGPRAFAAAVGGMAFAVACGIAFIPAPAGAGVRDAVLVLTLSPMLGADDALAAALASRSLLVVADVIGALVGVAVRHRLAGSGDAYATSTVTPEGSPGVQIPSEGPTADDG